MKRRPLIAHIVYALDTGGLENGLVNILNRMPADQFRHMVICLTTSGRFAERIAQRDELIIIELNKPPGHSLTTYYRLWRVLMEYRPDIIHSRNLAALECQWISALCPYSVKRVHSEHGRDTNDMDGKNRKYNLFRQLTQSLIHQNITVSQDLKGWLIDTIGVSPHKVHQIYNGVDVSRFFPPLENAALTQQDATGESQSVQSKPLVIGTVGRLVPIKNQRLLLKAVALMRQQYPGLPDVNIVIVGDGPLRAELERCAEELGLQEITHFLGDRDDVNQLLRAMNIFVLPSLSEGISNTLLEAMASGLPIVATAVGGTPEIITDGCEGYLVPSDDVEAMAAALTDLVIDSDLQRSFGSKGRYRVDQHFNWEKTIAHYLEVYCSLLPTSQRRSQGSKAMIKPAIKRQ